MNSRRLDPICDYVGSLGSHHIDLAVACPTHRVRHLWQLTPSGVSRSPWDAALPLGNVYCALKPLWLFVVDEALQFSPKLLSRSVAAAGVLRELSVRDLLTHRYGLSRPTGFEAVFLRPDRRLGRILEHLDKTPSPPTHSEFALHYLLAMAIESSTGRDARQWCASAGRRLLGSDVLVDARNLRGAALASWAERIMPSWVRDVDGTAFCCGHDSRGLFVTDIDRAVSGGYATVRGLANLVAASGELLTSEWVRDLGPGSEVGVLGGLVLDFRTVGFEGMDGWIGMSGWSGVSWGLHERSSGVAIGLTIGGPPPPPEDRQALVRMVGAGIHELCA